MRVTFGATFRNGVLDINRAAAELAERSREVSSQKRVQVASDDPSAAVGALNERTEMRTLDAYVRATDSVEARLTVTDTLLSDMIRTLTAAQSTAAGGRSTVLSPSQRQALALDLAGQRDAILASVNSQFRGVYLFSGTAATVAPYTKDAAGVVQPYAGNADRLVIDIDRTRSVEVTIDAQSFIQGTDPQDLFQVFDALILAVQTGDMAGIDAGIDGLNRAFQRLTDAQSRVGNYMSDLDQHRARLDEMRRASDTRRSKLEDANLAQSVTAMQQADTAYRAALGAVSRAAQLSLLDYLR